MIWQTIACIFLAVAVAVPLSRVSVVPGAPPPTTGWPALRRRGFELARDVYVELVCDSVAVVQKLQPPAAPGALTWRSAVANVAVWWVSLVVACVGRVEQLLFGAARLPCVEVREATDTELRHGAGALAGKSILPSAYDLWVGPRSAGRLRLRYGYDAARLKALGGGELDGAGVCVPLELDGPTRDWVGARLARPGADSRLVVWRTLKNRVYHYDAGVFAFLGFPRNYMLSEPQWADLLGGRPRGGAGTAIDVGAGDGSLTAAFRPLFSSVVATEVTLPMVHRLKALKLDARLAEALDPKALGRDAFDVAFIMNVLDRCKDPHALLRDTRALLPDDGWLVVSVVMPPTQSDAMARVGAKQRRWAVAGADFEAAAASLVRELLLPSGFEPLRLVRVPYLCAGDRHSPVAALDAAVLVLRKAEPREPRPLDGGGGGGGDDHSHGPN